MLHGKSIGLSSTFFALIDLGRQTVIIIIMGWLAVVVRRAGCGTFRFGEAQGGNRLRSIDTIPKVTEFNPIIAIQLIQKEPDSF